MRDIMKEEPLASPTLHVTILFTISAFIAVLLMSFIFKVEVVSRGQGRVVPTSRVQVVQPEFSGRIAAIHVQNGMSVKKGDVLIDFDPTEAKVELNKIQAEMDRLAIEAVRLDTLVNASGGDVRAFDFLSITLRTFVVPDSLTDHPFATEQRLLLDAELNDFLASLGQIDAREETIRKSEAVTGANIDRLAAAIEIQAVRLRTYEQLRQQGAASQSSLLDVQQAFTELEHERDVYLAELEQKSAERSALDSERRRIIAYLRNTLLDRKAQINARLATLSEEERTAFRRVSAATLRSPSSGIVDRLSVFTVGGIAEAGAELLRVVPVDIAVEVESTFSNQDIGFMAIGQRANIRLDAYPSARFGFLKGSVTDIAADSAEVADEQWAYIVRIEPDQAFLIAGSDKYPLRPGMTATIDVTTDERRIISYFFAPIVQTIQDAMGER